MTKTLVRIARGARGLRRYTLELSTEGGVEEVFEEFEARTQSEQRIVDAFGSLAAVAAPSPELLWSVQCVLDATIADPDGETVARGLPQRLGRARPRATAAHPRGYRGTLQQPPKSHVQEFDLRPLLLSPAGVREVVEWFGRVQLELQPPPQAWREARVLRLAFGELLGTEDGGLLRRTAGWLELERRDVRRRCFALVADASGARAACSLAPAVALLPEPLGDRLLFDLALAADPVAPVCDTYALTVAELCTETIEDGSPAPEVFARPAWLARHAGGTAMLERAAVGVRLSRGQAGPKLPAGEPPSLEFGRALLAHAELRSGISGYYLFRLWSACAADPSLEQAVLRSVHATLAPEARDGWAGLLMWLNEEDEEQALARKRMRAQWRTLLGHIEALESPWQYKAVEILGDAFWFGDLSGAENFRELVRRVCRAPFGQDERASGVYVRLLGLEEPAWGRLREAPDEAFLALERACRRANDASLIRWGLDALRTHDPLGLVEDLAHRPVALLDAAQRLGSVSRAAGLELLGTLDAGAGLAEADPGERVRRALELAGGGGSTHVPARLRAHVEGRRQLTPAQVERDSERLVQRWPDLRLEALARRVEGQLAVRLLGHAPARVDQLSRQMRHGVLLQARSSHNRRALRRLLRNTFEGRTGAAFEHPANARWLAALPERTARAWLAPPVWSGVLEGGQRIEIACVLDPLEALRLGTYVGSCLGLGGSFTGTAAAIALDANKHVAFARDERGAFVARQVLCLTRGGLLACQHVLPESSAALQRLFADFDRAFAEALGVELALESGDEPEPLVATKWWDDGTWNLVPVEDGPARASES